MPSVLITGASRGFGHELVEVYLRRGWVVFPLVRSREAAARWEERDGCHSILADVATPDVEQAIARVLNDAGGALDLLINNAGSVKKLRWLPDTSAEDIEELFRVHCVGAFRCTRAALPFLRRASAPTVVNISSRFGSISRMAAGDFRGVYSYVIAKCALNMLTVSLDQELRRQGIRVFVVHPGRLKTPVAAVDADTDPQVAAGRLVEWIESLDRDADCRLYDVMAESAIPW